ncbi:MBL fold metallo-hydrolase [Halalkalibacter sp. AB-rgal2]|uniref:MBL fold metallo-hydrolase n=1 Tax=Halalkalibacter sp. AB-rgal2 TaxID=3242695 RepID=UPI00359EEF83
MKVTFLGGVNEYGRSCFHLQADRVSILIDCGIMKNAHVEHKRFPLLNREIVESLDVVFITHSHEDHTAALPLLCELGFKGSIYATSATLNQTIQVLTSLQNGKQGYSSITQQFRPLEPLPRQTWLQLAPNYQFDFQYGYSGHTLGSVWFLFRINGEQIFFSGDYSTESPILTTDQPIIEKPIEIAILDGAYGNETCSQQTYLEEIYHAIEHALTLKKKVLLHGPIYGKLQDLLMYFQNDRANFLTDTAISQEIRASFEAYMNNQSNVKKQALKQIDELANQLQTIPLTTWLHNDSFSIGLFTEHELLKELTAENADNLLILCTGPYLEKIVAIGDKQPFPQYVQKRYKVHPSVYELHEQIKYLKPKRIVFSHSPNKQITYLQEVFTAIGEDVVLAEVGDVLEMIVK